MLEQKVLERTRDLELSKQKAEESDRLKSSFLANMSHEIRTPLNAILGFSSLIVDSLEANEQLASFCGHIANSSEMLLKIINDILDLSKIEAGQLEVIKMGVNLNHLIDSVYNTFQKEIIDKHSDNVKFVIKNPLGDKYELIIHTDMIRLKQIVFNLINNAIKFTYQGYIEFGFAQEPDIIKFYSYDIN